MSVAVWAILGVLAALLLVLALAMATPLRLELSLRKGTAWHYNAALRPFGKYGPRITIRGPKNKRPKKTGKARRKQVKSRFRPKRIIPAGLKLFNDILHRIYVSRAQLDVRFGLGDPGETGQLYGMLAPLIYGPTALPGVRLKVEPVFDDRPTFTGCAEMYVSVVPASIIAPAIRFGWRAFGPSR